MKVPNPQETPEGLKSPAAFTLVEIMISVVILGVGLTLVANSYIVALRGVNAAANNIQAFILAREKLNELEASSLKDGLSAFSDHSVLKTPIKDYNYALDVVEITQPKELAKNLVQACLTLSWHEQNVAKNATLSTYLPRQKQ